MKPIIVNLFGGPGSGKSTGAAYVFSQLKMHGINCELVTEYAKDKTWEHNMEALSNQAYVFGNQFYRISRCANQVDVIITDSPILLSVIYNNDPILGETFNKMVLDVFNSYDNLNYLLTKTKPYNPIGRNQTEEESDDIGREIRKLLEDNSIDYLCATGDIDGYTAITDSVLNIIRGEDKC
jgi:nicotinamide riboside kinase